MFAFLDCVKYANLPAAIGDTVSSCSKLDTSLSIAVVGLIVSPAWSSLYCAVSENNNNVSLNDTEFFNILTCVPDAAISIGSVSNTCVTVVAKKLKNPAFSDKIKLHEEKGRIIRSIGLPNDLHSIERPKLDFKMIIDKGYVSYIAYYSFRNPEMNNLRVEVKSTVIGPESVDIFGFKKELILIEERMYSPLIHWSAKNKFWYDPENDYVWKSKQYLTPKLPAIDIEVTKKPAI